MDIKPDKPELAEGHPLAPLQREVNSVLLETEDWLAERQPNMQGADDYTRLMFEGTTKKHSILTEVAGYIESAAQPNAETIEDILKEHLAVAEHNLEHIAAMVRMYEETKSDIQSSVVLPKDVFAGIAVNRDIKATVEALVGLLPAEEYDYQDTAWSINDFIARPDIGRGLREHVEELRNVRGRDQIITERQFVDENGLPVPGVGIKLIASKEIKED